MMEPEKFTPEVGMLCVRTVTSVAGFSAELCFRADRARPTSYRTIARMSGWEAVPSFGTFRECQAEVPGRSLDGSYITRRYASSDDLLGFVRLWQGGTKASHWLAEVQQDRALLDDEYARLFWAVTRVALDGEARHPAPIEFPTPLASPAP
jgi:hypothetical protein